MKSGISYETLKINQLKRHQRNIKLKHQSKIRKVGKKKVEKTLRLNYSISRRRKSCGHRHRVENSKPNTLKSGNGLRNIVRKIESKSGKLAE